MYEIGVSRSIRATNQKLNFRKVIVDIGKNIRKMLVTVLQDLCGLLLRGHGPESVLPGLDDLLQTIRGRLDQRLKYTNLVLKADIDRIGTGPRFLGDYAKRGPFKSLLQELLLGTFQYFFIDTGYLRFSHRNT